MQSTKELLQHFSFTPDEVDVYLATLTLGKPGVSEIAKKINKNRTATYFHVKKLLDRGIVKETRKGRALRFVALEPSQLAATLERLAVDFKSLVPQLESLREADQETPIIEVLESASGYYKIYDEISSMPEGSTFRVLQGQASLDRELKLMTAKQLSSFFERVIERKIETRGIFTEESLRTPSVILPEKNYNLMGDRIWHLRTLPVSQMPLQQLILIYGDKTAFMFPETSLVVTMKHKRIAEVMRTVFDALFMFARPQKMAWKG